MQKPILKMLNIAICLCMLLGLVTTLPNRVIAKEQLVNVARDERVEITADNTAGGHPVEYLVDGDDTTSWRSGFSSNKRCFCTVKIS